MRNGKGEHLWREKEKLRKKIAVWGSLQNKRPTRHTKEKKNPSQRGKKADFNE